jgi:hypothetical protein
VAVVEDDPAMEPGVLAPSYVSAPIYFDLRPLIREVEATIPRRIGSTERDRRIQVAGRVWVAPELRRGPLRFRFDSNTVSVATEFEYRARAWVRPLLVEFAVSCGMGEVRPRLRLRLATSYHLTPEWRLRTRTRLVQLEPVSEEERDQCDVSVLQIDVTGRVVSAAQDALRNALRRVDRDVARLDIRGPMSDLWDVLHDPIPLADSLLWLEIRPQAVSLGPVLAQDTALVARLDLLAMPRLTSGPRGLVERTTLPPLGQASGEAVDTAMILIEGALDYDAATRLLGRELVGRSMGVLWRRIRIEDVSVLPAGQGRLLLAVRLGGGARGVVHVLGTPHYDPTTDMITVPDLGFDLNQLGSLERVAGWLVRGNLLDELRQRARLRAGDLLGDVVVLANREINRELTGGVWLHGTITEAVPLTVVAARRGLVAQARGSGRLWLEISRENLLPDAPAVRLR